MSTEIATASTEKAQEQKLETLTEASEQFFRPERNVSPTDYFHISVVSIKDRLFFKVVPVYRILAADYNEAAHGEIAFRDTAATGEEVIGFKYHDASYKARSFLRYRLPECFSLDGDLSSWRVAMTDFNAMVFHCAWPKNQLIFTNDARDVYDFLLLRFFDQTHGARLQAEFKLNGKIPDLPTDFIEKEGISLAPYQRAALAISAGKEAYALFMEQGTGKTAVAVARICLEARWKRQGRMGEDTNPLRVLIVCPNPVRTNWRHELKKFSSVRGTVTLVKGGQMARMRLLAAGLSTFTPDDAFTAMVIGYDTLKVDAQMFGVVQWDLIILDESHRIKNADTDRFKNILPLRDKSHRRMLLTGSPVTNSIFDIRAQFEFLGEGLSGFSSNKQFQEFYANFEERGQVATGGTVKVISGYKNIPFFQERLSRLSFSITKADAGLNLPDKVYDLYEVEMTAKQVKVYNQLAEQLAAEIEDELSGTYNQMTVNNILVKLLRLAQVCSGHVKFDDADAPVQIDSSNPKVDAVLELLAEKEKGQKTIIWCSFVEDIRVLREALQNAGIGYVEYHGSVPEKEREEAYRRFNEDPTITVFLGNPRCAGEGLNLLGYPPGMDPEKVETWCDHEIFFSCSWSLTERVQGEDRAHRRGTLRNVRITDLIVPGTIDEEIRERVTLKKDVAMAVGDIRNILKCILLKD